MTYIVGWKNERSSFIVGDSLLTFEDKIPYFSSSISTFKQKLQNKSGDYQFEGCNKIFNFGGKLLIGFSTENVIETVEMLEEIEEKINFNDIRESLLNILPDKCPDDTELIIAFMEHNKPILAKYDKEINNLEDDNMAIQIGSGNDLTEFSNISNDICEKLEDDSTLSDEELLLVFVCIHQHLIVKHELAEFGAGGIITGARISSSGVHWQPSTSYVQYEIEKIDEDSPKFRDIGLIHLKFFKDVMAYYSSYIENHGLATNYLVRCDPEFGDWERVRKRTNYRMEQIDIESSEKFYSCPNCKYIVFFSNQKDLKSKIFIIRNNGFQKFANISCLDELGFYNIDVSKGFLNFIQMESKSDEVEFKFMN